MSFEQALIDVYKPVIYIPKEGPEKILREVLYEVHNDFVIFWYHWSYDDHMGHEDYEPVILFFKDNRLKAIGIRPHQSHKHYYTWLTEGLRPIIVFHSSWHAPYVFSNGILDPLYRAYTSPLFSQKIVDYNIVNHPVPEWFVRDGTSIPIHDFARQIVRSF